MVLKGRCDCVGQFLIVDREWKDGYLFNNCFLGASTRITLCLDDAPYGFKDTVPGLWLNGTYIDFESCNVRDDVLCLAGLEACDSHHRHVARVYLPANDRLQPDNHVRCQHRRIDGPMRHGTMTPSSKQGDLDYMISGSAFLHVDKDWN